MSTLSRILRRLANVPALRRHVAAARRARVDGSVDLELDLYAAIFQNDFLHAGYFSPIPPSPAHVSLASLKAAMDAYAALAVDRVRPGEAVLDVGCGMGALLGRLASAGARPTGVTPNPAHAEHIARTYPGIPVLRSGFEGIDVSKHRASFDTIVCLESFHNVPLEAGVASAKAVLKPGGRWLLIDYYRTVEKAYNNSGHPLAQFRDAVARAGFRQVEEIDITDNTTPTLGFFKLWMERFALPMLDFGAARFFLRHPLAGYLLEEIYAGRRGRVRLAALDPEVFARDKRYLLQVYSS